MDSRPTLRTNQDFQSLLWGRTLQMTGGAMTALALMLCTMDLTGSARWAAAVMAGNTVGALVASLPAGVLVDRWDHRHVMIGTSLVLAALLLSIPAAAALHRLFPLHLVLVSTTIGALGCFFGPAEQAALPRLVHTTELGSAASLNQARSSVANLLGPTLTGALYGQAHTAPLIADAVLNLLAAALVGRIRTPLPAAHTPTQKDPVVELVDGLRFVLATPALRAIVGMNALAGFGFGGLLTLVTLIFKARHLPDAVIGGMQTAYGMAGLLGALSGPWLLQRCRAGRLFIAGLLVNCGCAVGMALWPCPHVIVGLLCLACLTLPPGMAGIQAFQLTITPDELQGRVAAAMGFVALTLAPLAVMLAGVLVTTNWPLAVAPFLATIALTAAIALTQPSIRRLGATAA